MQLSHTQSVDVISRYEELLVEKILTRYLPISLMTCLEILVSSENEDFAKLLKKRVQEQKNIEVYITLTNGCVEEEINRGYRKFLDVKNAFYRKLTSVGFQRVTIVSPFPIPITLTNEVKEYQRHVEELSFVNEYLMDHPHTMIVKPNMLWAKKLDIKLEELWSILFELMDFDGYSQYLNQLNSLGIHTLTFESKEGTTVEIKLPKDSLFFDSRRLYRGISYYQNVPSKEVFTTPLKDGTNGTIVFTKPIIYKGQKIENASITVENGRVISSKGVYFLLETNPDLMYLGEVALCPYDSYTYMCTLLDENTGCHIALGNGFSFTTKEVDKIHHAKLHLDLIFGSPSLLVKGISKEKEWVLIQNGQWVL